MQCTGAIPKQVTFEEKSDSPPKAERKLRSLGTTSTLFLTKMHKGFEAHRNLICYLKDHKTASVYDVKRRTELPLHEAEKIIGIKFFSQHLALQTASGLRIWDLTGDQPRVEATIPVTAESCEIHRETGTKVLIKKDSLECYRGLRQASTIPFQFTKQHKLLLTKNEAIVYSKGPALLTSFDLDTGKKLTDRLFDGELTCATNGEALVTYCTRLLRESGPLSILDPRTLKEKQEPLKIIINKTAAIAYLNMGKKSIELMTADNLFQCYNLKGELKGRLQLPLHFLGHMSKVSQNFLAICVGDQLQILNKETGELLAKLTANRFIISFHFHVGQTTYLAAKLDDGHVQLWS